MSEIVGTGMMPTQHPHHHEHLHMHAHKVHTQAAVPATPIYAPAPVHHTGMACYAPVAIRPRSYPSGSILVLFILLVIILRSVR